jgi:hypothetical protein
LNLATTGCVRPKSRRSRNSPKGDHRAYNFTPWTGCIANYCRTGDHCETYFARYRCALSMAQFSVTGGARVGWRHASWPFAKLTVSETGLRISAFFLGSYSFASGEVVSLNLIGSIPFLSSASGIQIVHNRSDYSSNISFWVLGSAEKLLARIHEAGFSGTAAASSAIPISKAYRTINALAVIVAVVAILFFVLTQCVGKP